LFMADAEAVVKVVFRLIHKKDGKDLIGSNSVRQSGDLLKKTVQVEGRRDVMIDFNERCQKVWIRTQDRFHNLRASSTIATPELVPMREAPACNSATASL